MTCKLVFTATPGKLEYLQDTYNELLPEHKHDVNCIEYTSALYLEGGYWINYYQCSLCPQKLITFGRFGEREEEEEIE